MSRILAIITVIVVYGLVLAMLVYMMLSYPIDH